ncbi:endonuclease/exonuclease/phosphatase family protein [Actinomadura harenae]|uniref:endonuclease/exonuclease/phosphatase family protein n=1 Tax=Actinomadura harenae TaxID=2483351 RepID=UPI0013156800|nr:endonuclease/exonuclease/phosphatase family protein [Actinomadura harenae]
MNSAKPNGTLRVTTWNLQNGGLDRPMDIGGDSRLNGIIDRISAAGPQDVVFLQECRWGALSSRRLYETAAKLGMPGWGYLVPAPRFGCDLAVFVRQSDSFHVVQERHESGLTPWYHALLRVETTFRSATGQTHRIDLCGLHFAPSAPRIRGDEAEQFNLLGKVEVIAAGDFNARAIAELPFPGGLNLALPKIARKLDTTPAETIKTAGFADVGELAGDLTPTVGHDFSNGRAVPHRADRIYTNSKGVDVLDYSVLSGALDNGGRLSDHDGVTAHIRISG